MLDQISSSLKAFRNNECGAVTVDFVVLVATIVLLGLAVVNSFDDEVIEVTNDIVAAVANQKTR